MWKFIACLSVALCLTTLGVMTLAFMQMQRLTVAVERLNANVERIAAQEVIVSNPGELYTEWHSAGSPPILRSVTTPKRPTETVAEWRVRHQGIVDALMDTYPPI